MRICNIGLQTLTPCIKKLLLAQRDQKEQIRILLSQLDCWDGPDGEPLIYHGWTLTSKLLFKVTHYALCCGYSRVDCDINPAHQNDIVSRMKKSIETLIWFTMALACTTPISTMIGQDAVETANQIPSNQHLQRNLGDLNQ